jgi:hypothetical protein
MERDPFVLITDTHRIIIGLYAYIYVFVFRSDNSGVAKHLTYVQELPASNISWAIEYPCLITVVYCRRMLFKQVTSLPNSYLTTCIICVCLPVLFDTP